MLTVDYETSWGEQVRLAVCSDRYAAGGALALLALDATVPEDEEGYLDIWCSLTVNLPGDPVASAWCAGPGHIVVDANSVPAALLEALARGRRGAVGPLGAVRVLLLPPRDGPTARPRGAPQPRGDRAGARPAHRRPRVGGRRGRRRRGVGPRPEGKGARRARGVRLCFVN